MLAQTELTQKEKKLTTACISVFGIVLTYFFGYIPAIVATLFMLSGDRPTSIYSLAAATPRDLKAAWRFILINWTVHNWVKSNKTVGECFEETVKRYPNKVALMMDDLKLTFSEANTFSNRVASYFKSKGFKKGDSVALLMETKIEYPFFWIGLSKIGVTTALINYNLRKDPLVHSIKAAGSSAVIVSAELKEAFNEIRDNPDIKSLQVYQYNGLKDKQELLSGAIDLKSELDNVSIMTNFKDTGFSPKDKLVYIYTSGTTGLPKAAVITHARYMFMSMGVYYMHAIRFDDIIYNPLPLYHTAGGMCGIGIVCLRGVSMALRKKFSASNFWADCIKYRCTVAQYIGEICRFLLSTPPKPEDTAHNVRLIFGNGFKPQIWNQFVSRFNVGRIGEFYGSTEGNSNLVNINNTPGAVGFIPRSLGFVYPVMLVKCDEEGEPIRDANGRCTKCRPGEPGVFIGKIKKQSVANDFAGYSDKKATEKKIIKNVFEDGDVYFNSGDILVMDILYNLYFKDRTGDTFRWRGENVATSEVEAVISNIVGLKDCTVYGVEVPHTEGKAGMAAIVDPDNQLDLEHLSAGIKGALPAYARPLFIRVLKSVPMTSTFKVIKRDFVKDGFDLHKIEDPLYYLNSDGVYRKFTEQDYDNIINGKAKL
uniref:Very long-chain fatty acid transport protein n=1 Tax=Culicoides sonorensis TaxID=179676 RepID=A0A336K116_CULSO